MATTTPVSVRYSSDELRQLDATAKLCNLSRAEVIRQRSLGKILTIRELADWAEAAVARGTAQTRKGKGHDSRAA